ncbi:hypothetical protein [Pseudomonas sp. SWRI179]|uniref:Uncharacterized protein n=1 Tax=Pseudomonas zanjanensis TaxID=2745496 RepID=A0A923FEV2_9PSED|nr:hypothetical protein [Pseudomonas sp. SWRI179]MBC3383593.1 hypothetical protein [Pseudomonas sp. SWRI179]
MNNEVVLNYFDFSVYLVGSVLILNVLSFLKVGLWLVLLVVFIWLLFISMLCFKGRRLFWLEGEYICFRRRFKTVSFDRGVVEVSVRNCVFAPIEVVINMPGRREVFLLPRFIPEEQREFVIKMIERFCLEHNITYL